MTLSLASESPANNSTLENKEVKLKQTFLFLCFFQTPFYCQFGIVILFTIGTLNAQIKYTLNIASKKKKVTHLLRFFNSTVGCI